MDIKVIASSSKANCYIVNGIMFEAGLSIQKIKEALDFKLPEFCIISHSHGDHAKAVPQLIKLGVTCCMSQETANAIGVKGHKVMIVEDGSIIGINEHMFAFFNTEHDCEGSIGWLMIDTIKHNHLVFATDTYFVKNRFKKLNYIMVECNYCKDIIDKNVELGIVNKSLRDRIISSHFELENVKEFLKANNNKDLKEVYLMHLSDLNSDEKRMKSEVENILPGCTVKVC